MNRRNKSREYVEPVRRIKPAPFVDREPWWERSETARYVAAAEGHAIPGKISDGSAGFYDKAAIAETRAAVPTVAAATSVEAQRLEFLIQTTETIHSICLIAHSRRGKVADDHNVRRHPSNHMGLLTPPFHGQGVHSTADILGTKLRWGDYGE